MRYFDLHCDTLSVCEEQGCSLRENRLQLSLARGEAYRPWFQCFAVWIPDEWDAVRAWERFERISQTLPLETALCRTREDLLRTEAAGGCGAILTVEGGAVLGGSLERIPLLAQRGVRALTLTWNGSNAIGDGALVEHPRGLTAFGREAVLLLEKNGVAVDVSHAGEPLFWDVAELARRPLLATHSNARAVCGHPRNLTDAQFCAIRDSGGLVGLNFYPLFLRDGGKAARADILRHAEHFLALGGAQTLAIGSDFDGAQMPPDLPGVQAVSDLAEDFLRHGYPEELTGSIFYGNARRFFENLLATQKEEI